METSPDGRFEAKHDRFHDWYLFESGQKDEEKYVAILRSKETEGESGMITTIEFTPGNEEVIGKNSAGEVVEKVMLMQVMRYREKDDPPKLHPSIEHDPYTKAEVSRYRRIGLNSEHALDGKQDEVTGRSGLLCGFCAGKNVRQLFSRDDSCLAMKEWFTEVYCEDCEHYTTWDHND